LVEVLDSPVLSVGELIIWIPPPRSDHCQNEEVARPKQFLISAGITLADIFGQMS
jgi:hypothetical protein